MDWEELIGTIIIGVVAALVLSPFAAVGHYYFMKGRAEENGYCIAYDTDKKEPGYWSIIECNTKNRIAEGN